MRLRDRLRRWQFWKRRPRSDDEPERLREFVYLDDVSVYSLTASRRGGIATDITESETLSLQSESSTSAGVGVTGVAKADVASRLTTGQKQGLQVLRKAIVQSTFKELYDLEHSGLKVRPPNDHETIPPPRAITRWLESERGSLEPWIIDAAAIDRGDLIEVEVELGAERIFRVSALIAALVEMMRESTDLARVAGSTGEIGDIAAMAGIIDRLLVGLIPIRGTSLKFEIIEADERTWLARKEVAARLSEDPTMRRHPLFVVGVAEETLFWKDIRRILFSNSHYRVFARMSRPGVQTSWTPVKLVDVLRDVAPDLASQLGALTESLYSTAVTTVGGGVSLDATSMEQAQAALLDYAGLLAEQLGHALSEDELLAAGVGSATQCASFFGPFVDRLKTLREVTASIERHLQARIDASVAAQLR